MSSCHYCKYMAVAVVQEKNVTLLLLDTQNRQHGLDGLELKF